MRSEAHPVVVGTTPQPLFAFVPAKLHFAMIKAEGAMYWGLPGVSVATGVLLNSGESFALTYRDFNMKDPDTKKLLTFYGVAAAPTTVQVASFSW